MQLKPVHIFSFVLACALGCERSLTFDAQGVAHGTGERTYEYKSGAIKLREEYVDGKLVRSRWFKPDGTLVQETHWVNGTGEGVYLREDGSIRQRIEYVNGVAEGVATEYDELGRILNIVHYRAGQRIGESGPESGKLGE
jgi:antitoxin component YwqK of YwqJK toxin-antitoxin module